MINCIAIDMDGTLLNNKHVISEENAAAIREARSKGVEIVIATGRSNPEADYVLDEAGLSLPKICVNGADVRHPDGSEVSSTPLGTELVQSARNILQASDIYYEVYTNNGTYTNDRDKALSLIVDIFMSADPEHDYQEVVRGARRRLEEGRIQVIDDYDSVLGRSDIKVFKLLAFSLDQAKTTKAQEQINRLTSIAVSSSGYDNLEITAKQAQKGVALQTFAEARQIPLEQVAAIGDNYNDISMFQTAGTAVAMGNANDDIRNEADWVTATNDNNGVAQAILRLMNP
ncbi:Cof-type HAD-IIB family hydrolase [Tuberibacillus sp. Marseille-P3662]|uniref:Cof-type HAD-IIB family hydrolase n=1 Tax=Tuberibacillus sp. Marseille-P3662 TaxID=1965358 RepID=UPI000A1C88BF|nr:Cof-type HAD-IIB family hydrolase [Tuberibacillus sp. Marseille-P3662]